MLEFHLHFTNERKVFIEERTVFRAEFRGAELQVILQIVQNADDAFLILHAAVDFI